MKLIATATSADFEKYEEGTDVPAVILINKISYEVRDEIVRAEGDELFEPESFDYEGKAKAAQRGFIDENGVIESPTHKIVCENGQYAVYEK